MEEFRQFDIASDFSDHRFAAATSNLEPAAAKAVMKEWKILQNNLPAGSIYVRVYDHRLDLLRAAIVGPQKTPYHDGLFFFDFQFPPNYPAAPPKAHYKSYGLHLNPNLYGSGKVCLSLLNTWHGPKESRWQPRVSTMLQVLVSIQGLVLNHAPLHNEPLLLLKLGNTTSSYNDTAFVMSCETMLCLLLCPPKSFPMLIGEHFRARGRAILTACQVYLNGFARVGDYEYEGDGRPFTLEMQRRIRVSSDFETSLKEQYRLLVTTFSRYDPSLKGFCKELDRMVDNAVKNSPPPPRTSMVKLVFGKLFGWMRCIDARP